MAESPFIVDVTRENFNEVLEASFSVPVLLDFWATWCQPCLALTPVLTRLAEEFAGRFLLGKVNTEEQQEIAVQFGIRGIPNVKLFREGRLVDEFTGALPEAAVRQFLERHVPRESDSSVQDAEALLRGGDAARAVALLSEARAADPDNSRIALGLARAQAAAGDAAAAEATLDSLPAAEKSGPEASALRSQLFFAGQLAAAPAAAELEARLAADPRDFEALYQLAMHKVIGGDYETAMELLLQLMRQSRTYGDDAGRRALVKVFELLGPDPLVSRYRGRMTSLLF